MRLCYNKKVKQLIDQYFSQMTKRLKLAIQRKGRLGAIIPKFLDKAGLDFEIQDRQLICSCSNFPLDLLFIRHKDVIPFVESQQADLGIVGSDLYAETGSRLKTILELDFAKSTLTLAVLKGSKIKEVAQLENKTIATTFPKLTKKYFKKLGMPVKIITLSGSVEVAPKLEIADAITDLVGTGATLRQNGLRSLAEIMRAQAILLANSAVLNTEKQLIEELSLRFQSVRDGNKQKYVLFNLPEKNICKVHEIFPGLAGPSIIKVEAKTPTVAIHVVVPTEKIWKKIVQLRAIGATGILIIPIDNLLF